jgi:hypothetical protein
MKCPWPILRSHYMPGSIGKRYQSIRQNSPFPSRQQHQQLPEYKAVATVGKNELARLVSTLLIVDKADQHSGSTPHCQKHVS